MAGIDSGGEGSLRRARLLWTLQEAESGRATYKRASAARGGRRSRDVERTVAVELSAVTKRFGEFVAVDDLTLDIYEGEFFSLLGPSGCGKTTTLRMIAGFEEPTEGGISVAGEPMRGVPPYRRPVNTVFQSYAIFPHLNVFDNVAFGLRRRRRQRGRAPQEGHGGLRDGAALRLREAQAEHALRRPAAEGRAREGARQPSRRCCCSTSRWEPWTSSSGRRCSSSSRDLQHEVGITFVYVTHDQEEALTMSDRIAVMNEGRVQQVADPPTLYELPNEPLRRQLHRPDQRVLRARSSR